MCLSSSKSCCRLSRERTEPFAEKYFSVRPIHEMLYGRGLLTTSNYLRVNLCHMHEEPER
jgi:hypothetical protein